MIESRHFREQLGNNWNEFVTEVLIYYYLLEISRILVTLSGKKNGNINNVLRVKSVVIWETGNSQYT